MFRSAILDVYKETCDLVGVCDSNAGRLRLAAEECRLQGGDPKPYAAEDFDRMVRECRAQAVVVTTKDCHHDEYVCRGMELGCDVITEKPMTTDEQKCQRIIDTQRRTGRQCRVTFNYRYSPPRTQLKDLLISGVIGNVISVDFHWLLDTSHGADYFRRWHRNKVNSGGLMVHKATHHFDLVNWFLSAIPVQVFASGDRQFYTPKTAWRYGLSKRAERCLDCPEKSKCNFFLDLAGNEHLKKRYLDNEQYDGYFRDRCVFSELIDIEDTMNLVVNYDSGTILTYSLNAFMPWEGYTISFNGTKGRLEHVCRETVYVSGDGSVPGELISEGTTTTVYPHFKDPYRVEVWQGKGGHGGGDRLLLQDVFDPGSREDKYNHAADHRGGAYSILTGVAANRSMASGQPVRIDQLCTGIGYPDYPPMPRPDEPLPMEKPTAVRSRPGAIKAKPEKAKKPGKKRVVRKKVAKKKSVKKAKKSTRKKPAKKSARKAGKPVKKKASKKKVARKKPARKKPVKKARKARGKKRNK